MIQSDRNTTGLNGETAVDSVYNVPDVDPAYRAGNLQYSGVPENATTYVTTKSGQNDRGWLSWTDSLINNWLGIGPALTDKVQDGEEQDEKAMEANNTSTDDTFALSVLGVVFIGFVIVRVFK